MNLMNGVLLILDFLLAQIWNVLFPIMLLLLFSLRFLGNWFIKQVRKFIFNLLTSAFESSIENLEDNFVKKFSLGS